MSRCDDLVCARSGLDDFDPLLVRQFCLARSRRAFVGALRAELKAATRANRAMERTRGDVALLASLLRQTAARVGWCAGWTPAAFADLCRHLRVDEVGRWSSESSRWEFDDEG